MIPITPGLCNYALPKSQYGCTQPTKTKKEQIEKKSPATELQSLLHQQHNHHQGNT